MNDIYLIMRETPYGDHVVVAFKYADDAYAFEATSDDYYTVAIELKGEHD